MEIWKIKPSIETLNSFHQNNMPHFLGIEFTEIGEDYMIARMPVNDKTKQPMGLLHGGASVVLAETVGSVASTIYAQGIDPNNYCVGLAINANHIRSARSGFVYGKATALHLGRTTHVWAIEIKNEEGKLICTSRLTVAVKQHQ